MIRANRRDRLYSAVRRHIASQEAAIREDAAAPHGGGLSDCELRRFCHLTGYRWYRREIEARGRDLRRSYP